MSERFKLITEVHLILFQNDEALMLLRKGTGYMDGYWSLVAGHVDGNETFRAAMAREALEEAGLRIAPEDLHLTHLMHRKSDTERISLFFAPKRWSGQPRNMEPHKCEALKWTNVNHLPSNTVPYIRSALKHISDGTLYSEFGW